MASEPNEPAQTEGAGQTANSRPEPVNLALVEAAKRGLASTPPAAPEPKAELPPPPPIEDETPAAAPEQAPASAEPASDLEALKAFSEAATRGRLAPNDEDRATRLMRDFIKAGQPAPALEAMAQLPWILGVRATEQSWPALDEAARAALLEGLIALPGDNAARLRLSLSRSLVKVDQAAGLRLASLTCNALWQGDRGALSAEHSKLIGNVFIGRGKPWVLQLPLAGLPPEEALPIASCAVFSAFNVNSPPITQLSILRYAGPLLGSLHENLLALVARGLSRWSGKWQNALRKEVAELPPALAAALKPEKGDDAPNVSGEIPTEEEVEIPLPPELEEKLKIATESGDADLVESATQEINAWREAQRAAQQDTEEAAEKEDDGRRGRRPRGRERAERTDRPEKKERPAYVSREQAREQSREPAREGRESRESRESRSEEPPRGAGSFNLQSVLRQIESQFQTLRNELSSAQAKLRKGEGGRRGDRISLSVEEASLTPDELRRLVLQLETRNSELQSRVEELLADSELRAQTSGVADGGPEPDVLTQLRSLLALKLQDGYADFIALEQGQPDVIVRQHYRGLLREIFAVLIQQGIPLVGELPPSPPAPMPPPPPAPVDEAEDGEEDEDDELDPVPEDLTGGDAGELDAAAEEEAPDDDDLQPLEGEAPDEPEQPEEPSEPRDP